MRRSRSLTVSEKWDLGLLLSLFIVTSLVLAALWKAGSFNSLLAMAFGPSSVKTELTVAPVEGPDTGPSFQSIGTPVFTPDEPEPQAEPARLQAPPAAPKIETKMYKGEKYRYVKTIRMRVTAYAADPRCCWPYDGTTTASGLSVKTNNGKLVAADTSVIPFHDLVSIPGYNSASPVPVLDRGGAIKGARLDVLLPSYDQAKAWGSRMIDVKIYEPVDK